MIKRLGIGLVLVAALVVPASASAEPSPSDFRNAAKHCKQLRAQLGVEAFRAQYGSNHNKRNAFGKCVSEQLQVKHRLFRAALRECKAEYAADPAAFLAKYGEDTDAETSRDGERPEGVERPEGGKPEGVKRPEGERADKPSRAVRQAIRRCVRSKVKLMTEERRAALATAIRECRAELLADPVAFRAKYGPSRGKRHALRKCVAEHLADDTSTEQS